MIIICNNNDLESLEYHLRDGTDEYGDIIKHKFPVQEFF